MLGVSPTRVALVNVHTCAHAGMTQQLLQGSFQERLTFLIKWRFLFIYFLTDLMRLSIFFFFFLSGKQDYKKTKSVLRATRLKAEAKKTSSGFRVNLRSALLTATSTCSPLSESLPAVFCPSSRHSSVCWEPNNTSPPASTRCCVSSPLKNPRKDRNVLHFCFSFLFFNTILYLT